MMFQKVHEVRKMIFKSFLKSLIKHIDRGMTISEMREFLVELLG